MKERVTIRFEKYLIQKLNVSTATACEAVAEAALAAVAQDERVTVRAFSDALRECAPMLGTSTQVIAAAVKAAKEKGASLEDVTAAMADAADKKRRDDRKRLADRAAAKPAEDLKKAIAKVEECRMAMRTPLQVAQAELAHAEERVKQAYKLLREARADLRKARAKVEAMTEPTTEKAEQAA